ncbi:hypothetical protein VNO78_20542 [Psophocarpus tetragonolobus]|uniref:Uncharacterized protein n=1 Tax=Psophocarpus tetragonolobus TaxID=3891 RepID=A0AAN9SAH3_PSOTE
MKGSHGLLPNHDATIIGGTTKDESLPKFLVLPDNFQLLTHTQLFSLIVQAGPMASTTLAHILHVPHLSL